MTTLAEMATEQRAECVGLWCDILPGTPRRGASTARDIIRYVDAKYRRKPNYAYLVTLTPAEDRIPHEFVVPRFDLPRAWTPQGKPVPMTVEYGGDEWDMDREEPFHWPLDDNNSCCQDIERTHRRFVTKWEELPSNQTEQHS